MALLSQIKVWVKEKLKAADLNAEFQNVYSHLTPDYIEDASATDGEMTATKDPYPAGALSKPASMREEVQVLRYLIKQITGKTTWPEDPDRALTQCIGSADSNEFTASQHLDGDALLWRFRDTGSGGKEWGIRSDGGNLEICENTGTEAVPIWTVRKQFLSSYPDGYISSTPSDHGVNGPTTTLTAAESLAFGNACYVNSAGKMAKGDADSIGTAGILAMAAATISGDAAGLFALPGSFIRDDDWNWTTGFIYLDTVTPGGLTQTPPSGTDDAIQIVGIATHADRIFFFPQLLMYTHT